MWHQMYSQWQKGWESEMHLMYHRTEKIKCKWTEWKRPVRKSTGTYLTLFSMSLKWLFKNYWNITLWEIKVCFVLFWPVYFLHSKIRNRAAILTEKNDEGRGDAEWHLQGRCVTTKYSSYRSKEPVWLWLAIGFNRNLSLVSVAFLACCENRKVF